MRIYVGNLKYSVNDDTLRAMFSEFGEVASADVIKDKFSGQSKGFGFVDMPSKAEAEDAIQALNDTMQDGRKLTVNEAKPRTERAQQRF
ncbi:RNA-binding protein [Lamprobacter modestohalophilus]|uniref:RNA-binding protein n=1 Tax=Lamprobacter modestohalophilus TaxID=1064514 RepID=A0A9X1B3Z4_9GAMM|nr:RNA-binding protein [Lamprobacter modestohalophilus]MCF7995426.1 RNA-binding protein [Chromatiaceae bacterium]MBK1618930.1 RNA-binding protein [Lamprobacter modestohalophilus]MCF8002944.1 RNA-binding protein [Chromatiaceae bacterium]MCF8014169.1 RNA-binding protein [Chromatiaceae bacterium]MEA1049655.1 RNA-binding protein [Lamprobacter modestohalophilus]